jgi:hypothetical protein
LRGDFVGEVINFELYWINLQTVFQGFREVFRFFLVGRGGAIKFKKIRWKILSKFLENPRFQHLNHRPKITSKHADHPKKSFPTFLFPHVLSNNLFHFISFILPKKV